MRIMLCRIAAVAGAVLVLATCAAGQTTVVLDDADASLSYSNGWAHERDWAMAAAGTISYTNSASATATLRFNGDRITYVFTKAPNRGIAVVAIDGVARPELDLYSTTIRWQTAVTYSDLSAGVHSVEIRATGRKNAASRDAYVDVDRLIANAPFAAPGGYDDAGIAFVGEWRHEGADAPVWPAAYGGTVSYTNTRDSAATLLFRGEMVTYVYTRAPNRGKAAITIDGVDRPAVDLYAPADQITWRSSTTFSGLGPGIHQIHISVSGERDAAAEDGFVDVDAIQAGYRLDGLNFSPFVDGQDPNAGSQVSEEQIHQRLALLAGDTDWVRGFGSTGGMESFARIAHERGFHVAASAWLSRDMAANEREIGNLITAMKAGYVDLAIVGSEVLLRGDLSVAQLVAYLLRVRREAPGIPVATADVYGQFLSHPELIQESDVVMVNIYPYWERVSAPSAMHALDVAYESVRQKAGGKPVIVSEAGWPSCGSPQGTAVPSPQNAGGFLQSFVSWARIKQVRYFYFEAFDESWKAKAEGPQGACWGIRDKDGNRKAGTEDAFAGTFTADTWTTPVKVPAGPPSVALAYVPPYGSFDDLVGTVSGVDPTAYRVAVYIKVGAGWWTKPFSNAPLTVIQADGWWAADVTTGGIDETATEVAAFLVPSTFQAPVILGGALPTSLDVYPKARTQRELPCSYSVAPAAPRFLAGADEGQLTVTTGARCSWTAASETNWLTVAGGAGGTGSGTVRFNVGANTTGASRSGMLRVAGLAVPVSQGDEGFHCAPPYQLQYGDMVYCSIDTAGASTTYQFSGTAGETVMAQVSFYGGTDFYPCVELIAPDGLRATDCRMDFASRLEQVLKVSGTYTLRVSGRLSFALGSYVLSLERLTPPSPAAAQIAYGATITGQNNPGGDFDVFSFDGAPGERVAAWAATTGGLNYMPCLELIRPDNTRSSGCGLSLISSVEAVLTQAGPHTILLRSYYAFAAGTYTMTLQRTVPPTASAPRLAYGETLTGNLSPPGKMDLYAFDGVAGDSVSISSVSLGGLNFEPCLQLIAPDGSKWSSCGLALGFRLDRVLAQTGAYSIAVFDHGGAIGVGRYTISLACTAGPCAP